MVGCRWCVGVSVWVLCGVCVVFVWCLCRVLCCASVLRECGVCAESVWSVRFVFWCCAVLCCVVMCGVGAGAGVQCVVCGVCGVCAWCVLCVVCVVCVAWRVCCVTRLGTRKTPCTSSKCLRVYVQNASVCTCKTRAC